jgi:hypothetical protein
VHHLVARPPHVVGGAAGGTTLGAGGRRAWGSHALWGADGGRLDGGETRPPRAHPTQLGLLAASPGPQSQPAGAAAAAPADAPGSTGFDGVTVEDSGGMHVEGAQPSCGGDQDVALASHPLCGRRAVVAPDAADPCRVGLTDWRSTEPARGCGARPTWRRTRARKRRCSRPPAALQPPSRRHGRTSHHGTPAASGASPGAESARRLRCRADRRWRCGSCAARAVGAGLSGPQPRGVAG